MESENEEQTSVTKPDEFLDSEGEEKQETVEDSNDIPKIEDVDVDLDELDEVERERQPEVDLEQFRLKNAKIEAVESIRINSPYAKAKDGKMHKIKVTGEVVETLEREGQDDINFRPTELLDLEEDDEGNLIGLPAWDKSKWQRFKKVLHLEKPSDAIGKELPMSVTHNKKTDKDYLGFMY